MNTNAPDFEVTPGLNFENVVYQEGKKVYNLAYRLCGNSEEAKDIVQETFMKAYENFHRFQGKSQVFTYLYRITFNIWKNRIRYKNRHPIFSLQHNGPEEKAFDPPDPAPPPDKILETEEKSSLVKKCLESLDPAERLIIVMRDIEGKSYEEITRVLNCRLGTVKSRLARARGRLREILSPHLKILK